MKTFREAFDALLNAHATLICGGESSGKTRAVGDLVRELSMNHTVLVLSTHKDIKTKALKPEMVECLYKPKNCTNVDLSYLNTNCDYVFIDERCENVDEILNGIHNNLVFVKSIEDKPLDEDLSKFDLILIVDKDENKNVVYKELITKK